MAPKRFMVLVEMESISYCDCAGHSLKKSPPQSPGAWNDGGKKFFFLKYAESRESYSY